MNCVNSNGNSTKPQYEHGSNSIQMLPPCGLKDDCHFLVTLLTIVTKQAQLTEKQDFSTAFLSTSL